MEIAILIIPLVTCLLFWAVKDKKTVNIVNVAGSGALLLSSLFVISGVLRNGSVSTGFFGSLVYIDSFSALILLVTTFIGFLISIYSIGYMDEEYKRKLVNLGKLKVYYSLLHAFIFTMVLTTITQNMGVMWIAIEATTLASAFLVGFYNNKKSIEAAWKYIIICSVGIAFALLGIIMVYYSSVNIFSRSIQGLNWQFLFENAKSLQGSILKIAFIFILIGFGTKVGLAPMHTWLPDAHSQAPSPISALLSGVLLNTAMYGIVRVMTIVNKNAGSSLFAGRLLIVLGIVSIGTAAIFILAQQDFKRLLAYSSIEHMGIIALGFGMMTPLSVFGALFHVINHSLTKSMLFAASGNIYLKYETKKMNKIQGIFKVMPVTGTVFLLGIFAITGLPPFSVFMSELNIIIASFEARHYLIAALFLLFLTLIFAGFITQMVRMFYGKPFHEEIKVGETSISGSAVLILFLVLISAIGFYLPSPVKLLLESARDIIAGGI